MTSDPSDPPSGDSCPMNKLSMELLLRITFWLKTPDLCNMRLTCHSVERCIYDSFVEEFIARKQFMMTSHSLQALVELTKSPIGAHLRRLQLGTDMLILGFPDDDDSSEEAKKLYSEHTCFLRDGSHRRLLSEVFRNIHAHRGQDFEVVIRDFNSRRRTRDAPPDRYAEWNSYGTKTARSSNLEVRKYRPGRREGDLDPSLVSVFRDVCIGLADANVQPKGIEVMNMTDDILSEKAFYLNPLESNVPNILRGLEKLHLDVGGRFNRNLDLGRPFDPEFVKNHIRVAVMAQDALPKFLHQCSSLKDLRINQESQLNTSSEAFLAWFSERASPIALSQGWPAPVTFDNLESLSLGKTHTRPATLMGVLTKFVPTLRSLQFWRVSLSTPFEHTSIGDTQEPKAWKNFLTQLSTIKELSLQHIMISKIAESFHSGEFVNLRPHAIRRLVFSGNYMHEWRGTDCHSALRDMVQDLSSMDPLEGYKRLLWTQTPPDPDAVPTTDDAGNVIMSDVEDEDEDEDEDIEDNDSSISSGSDSDWS